MSENESVIRYQFEADFALNTFSKSNDFEDLLTQSPFQQVYIRKIGFKHKICST